MEKGSDGTVVYYSNITVSDVRMEGLYICSVMVLGKRNATVDESITISVFGKGHSQKFHEVVV